MNLRVRAKALFNRRVILSSPGSSWMECKPLISPQCVYVISDAVCRICCMIIALWPPRLAYSMQTLYMHDACRLLCRSRSEITAENLNEQSSRDRYLHPYHDLSNSRFVDTQSSNIWSQRTKIPEFEFESRSNAWWCSISTCVVSADRLSFLSLVHMHLSTRQDDNSLSTKSSLTME